MAGHDYYSIQTYYHPGGAGETFTIPFPFIRRTDVAVFIGGNAVPSRDFVWANDSQVTILPEVSMGLQVVFRRNTRRDKRLVEYSDGSMLGENDLNLITRQLLYINQELYDYLIAADSPTPPPGGVGGGGDGDGDSGIAPGVIDEIIAELLDSQLIRNLTEAIKQIDINAESIMSTIAKEHERWGEGRRYGGLIAQLDEGLEAVDARVLDLGEAFTDEQQAVARRLEAVQTRFDDAAADIVTLRESISTTDDAVARHVDALSARIGDNEALIGNTRETYATREYTQSYVQEQLVSNFAPEAFDGLLNRSEIIAGMRTTADRAGSTTEAITSYLAGSGVRIREDGSVDWNNPAPGSLAHSLSGVQATSRTHADQLATEAAFRQALASRFSPGNAPNPTPLVSAMEQAWKTYADSQSTTAQRVTTLESNRQPVFFRGAVPNWTAAEFAGGAFASDGFPEGSSWYREITPGFYVPYTWKRVSSHTADGYAYGNFGPFGGKPGMWIEVRNRAVNDAVGALAQTVEATYLRNDRVGATVANQLQAVYGPNYASINSRLESWINPGTGLMYSGWDMRINQTGANGVPVIAGIGIGMQNDPANPQRGSTSSVVMMADRFAVVRPPIGGDYINGGVDTSSMVSPFVVDTATNTVGINGRLLVRGSLSAYDGVVGRLVVANVDGNGNYDGNGPRLVLPTSTNNWNASNGASPFVGGSNPQRFLLWSGSGVMNHNNAKFYVDTDGNTHYAGEVSARNITQQFQRITAVDWSGSLWARPGPAATEIVSFALDAPFKATETHIPLLQFAVNVQSRSGENGVVQLWLEQLELNGTWSIVRQWQLNHGGGHGINHAISAVLPATNRRTTFRLGTKAVDLYPDRMVVQSVTGSVMGVR